MSKVRRLVIYLFLVLALFDQAYLILGARLHHQPQTDPHNPADDSPFRKLYGKYIPLPRASLSFSPALTMDIVYADGKTEHKDLLR
jgi:hypothetical protein